MGRQCGWAFFDPPEGWVLGWVRTGDFFWEGRSGSVIPISSTFGQKSKNLEMAKQSEPVGQPQVAQRRGSPAPRASEVKRDEKMNFFFKSVIFFWQSDALNRLFWDNVDETLSTPI